MMKVRGSIFFKLLGILIITGVLVNFLFYFALRFFWSESPIKRDMFETFSQENLRAYAIQIGNPPDLKKMAFIAESTGSEIRVESKGQVWQTSDSLIALDKVERSKKRRHERWKAEDDESPGHPHAKRHDGPPKRIPLFFDFFAKPPPPPAFVIRSGDAKYGFFLEGRGHFAGRYRKLVIPLLLLVTFLIASAFFAIRYILLPVNTLIKGVEAVARGDLDYRVEAKGGAEFASLSSAFNSMVERIKETMEAKERLLIDVSHELQSPLARMKLAIELMPEEKAKDRLKLNLRDIETMVAEILESARLDSSPGALSLQKTELRALIGEFLVPYETMGSPVSFESREAAIFAMIDPSRLIVVLRNLVENALKHADASEKRVVIRLRDETEGFRIEVKDNGLGIEAAELKSLFEPFYRPDRSRTRATGGYGLGLSLCKRIVDAHKGEIGIKSDGEGTTVWITLPKAP